MIFEAAGFLLFCAANLYFSLVVGMMFLYGGGDLGPLLTGWVSWKNKLWGVIALVVNIFFWYVLLNNLTFSVSLT